MARVLTNEQNYYDIANTIRQMKNVNTTYKPREMASALKDIYSNEVEGVPPLTFESNGMPLIDYRIDGANGGVGERTKNLFNFNGWSENLTTNANNELIISNNSITITAVENDAFTIPYYASHPNIYRIDVLPNSQYVLSWNSNNTLSGRIYVFKNGLSGSGNYIQVDNARQKYITFSTNENTNFITIRFGVMNAGDSITYSNIQLEEGSTATDYEPYGYKVPVVVKRKANHTATLQLHDCLPTTMMFDAPEALYYAKNGLSAGTYCFTIQNGYDTAFGGGKTYNFTILNDIEAGGQITFGWSYNTQAINSKITTYKSDLTTVIDDNIPVFEGNSGTNLGTTDGNSTNLNHIQCVRYGSNNYVQGAIRQFLNSSENAGSVWQPQTKFDRSPDWNSEMSGFLRNLDSNFLAVVGKSRKVVARNNPTDGGGYVTFEDKFFLLSRSEVFGGNESVLINEGEPYLYYSNNSDLSTAGTGNDTNRIKNRNGSAQTWGLRTVITSSASHLRTVNTSGGIGNIYANNKGDGVAPACNIEIDEDYKYNDTILNVGDQISVSKGNDTLVFDVIGIDIDENVYFESETTNIYLDEPINENESISLSDTEVDIPTIEGTNTLTIDTTVQPSNVYIQARKDPDEIVFLTQVLEEGI